MFLKGYKLKPTLPSVVVAVTVLILLLFCCQFIDNPVVSFGLVFRSEFLFILLRYHYYRLLVEIECIFSYFVLFNQREYKLHVCDETVARAGCFMVEQKYGKKSLS